MARRSRMVFAAGRALMAKSAASTNSGTKDYCGGGMVATVGFDPESRCTRGGRQDRGLQPAPGVVFHLFRAIASNKPGILSTVGQGTFVDPRIEGGKDHAVTTEDLVEVVELNGEESLFYKSFPINVALIRGTDRPVRQHHHGTRGLNTQRQPVDGHGRAQQQWHCHRAG